ncbi:MAG: undecaprenyl-diphosphate phosphatase [Rhodanobacteraceae bacterium]|nr:undecaprenyl-diphosphate phosphatase [Rhodanobacteraceae bacterium]
MNDILNVALLGLIEGITEFLPISSTGHLLIAEHWLGARSDLFNITIQAGAILAICLLYRQRLWRLASGLGEAEPRRYAVKLLVAFAITSVLGLAVSQAGFKLPTEITPIAWALIIGGLWILLAERLIANKPEVSEIAWHTAVLVGVLQVVAGMFPGTSRSAATIFVALLAGTTSRAAATEFAFLVGIPTMFAASGYELLKTLKTGQTHENWSLLGIAFAVSCLTAFIAVRWLLGYIRTHRFTVFAWYRIALGLALLLGLPAGT